MPIASELGDAAFLWPKAHESTSALDRGRVLVGRQLQEIDMDGMTGKQTKIDAALNIKAHEIGS